MQKTKQASLLEPMGAIMFSTPLAIPPTMGARADIHPGFVPVYCEALEDHLTSVNLEFRFCELEIRASALLSSEASVDEAMRGALCQGEHTNAAQWAVVSPPGKQT